MLMIDQPDEQALIRNLSNANARLTKALTALTAERDAERAQTQTIVAAWETDHEQLTTALAAERALADELAAGLDEIEGPYYLHHIAALLARHRAARAGQSRGER